MSIFLFLKQIIDIFYNFNFGDYCLATTVVIIIVNQIWLNRPDEGEKLTPKLLLPDMCMIIIGIILLVNMIIQLIQNYQFQTIYTYGKVGSAILLYLLGRICYKRIDECPLAILASSYIVVYVNLIYRIMNCKSTIFDCYEPWGDLYYYDTDMAFSITMAMIFISILGRNTIIKFITIFAVCPFMVFHSTANVQKVLMVVLLVILFIYMGERAVKKKKFTDFIMPLSVLVLIIMLVIMIAPVFTGEPNNWFMAALNEHIIGTDNMMDRYKVWSILWNNLKADNLKDLLIGQGLMLDVRVENAYLAILFSSGVIGLVSALIFVLSISGAAMKIADRPTYYITIMLAILFLGSCINKNGIEFTQMSWFVMMYFGMGATLSTMDNNKHIAE